MTDLVANVVKEAVTNVRENVVKNEFLSNSSS